MSRIFKWEFHNGECSVTLAYGWKFNVPGGKYPIHAWDFPNREAALAAEEDAVPCQCKRCAAGVRKIEVIAVRGDNSGDLTSYLQSQVHGRGMWK